MISFFTIPKAFHGHIGIVQANALRSWKLAHPNAEIFLCGNEPGVAEFAAAEGYQHLWGGPTTSLGTPLLSYYFQKVSEQAAHRLLVFANADILFLDDLGRALQRLRFRDFLLVGTRYNLDVPEPIEFNKDWHSFLRARLDRRNNSGVNGSDYFAFPKSSTMVSVPPFAVGRPGWDNWMFLRARLAGIPLIDASVAVIDIHQNHDYKHLRETRSGGGPWEGPEGDANLVLYFRDLAATAPNFAVAYPDETQLLASLSPEEAPEAIRQIERRLHSWRFQLRHSTHYLEPNGKLHRWPLRHRLASDCEVLHILRPNESRRNAWLKRLSRWTRSYQHAPVLQTWL